VCGILGLTRVTRPGQTGQALLITAVELEPDLAVEHDAIVDGREPATELALALVALATVPTRSNAG